MQDNNQSGVNTILLVIVIMVVVGGAAWLFTRGGAPTETEDADINVTLPMPDGENGDNSGA